MSKPRLLHFSQKLSTCPIYEELFSREFSLCSTDSTTNFVSELRKADAEAAVVCICSAHPEDLEQVLSVCSLCCTLPVLICSQSLNMEFVSYGASRGLSHFTLCSMPPRKVYEKISDAIRNSHIREFIQVCYGNSIRQSPYVARLISEIARCFPHRVSCEEIAKKLGISRCWLYRQCRQVFGISYSKLIRRLRICQALNMMRDTPLDNGEIALELNYSEESNMARDFRSELGFNPTEARKHLINNNPLELMQNTRRAE